MSFAGKGILRKRLVVACLAILSLSLGVFPLPAYAAPGSETVSIHIEQEFEKVGSSLAVNEQFIVELTPLDGNNPMPAGSIAGRYSFVMDGTTSMDITPIVFTIPGVYQYEIMIDSSAQARGYSYDTEVYTVTVYISAYSSGLVSDVVIENRSRSKVNEALFLNTYRPLSSNPVLMVDPPVNKTVSGSPTVNGLFTFTLTAGNLTNPMPKDSLNGVKTIHINGPGEVEFGTWFYTEDGSYYYTVAEVRNDEWGYSYDSTVYTISDIVRDVGGQLEIERTVTNVSNKQVDALVFINEYSEGVVLSPTASPGSFPFTGDTAEFGLYLTMIVACSIIGLACLFFLFCKRCRDNRDENTTERQ